MSGTELRVGTDIQSVEDVACSISQFGSRYLTRLFTAHEVRSSGGSGEAAAPGLAARFAAKEAFFKVLRSPDLMPPWTSVEVVRQPGGWTDLHLHGTASVMADGAGISSLALSLSHDAGFGVAVVIATIASRTSLATGRGQTPERYPPLTADSEKEPRPWTN